MLDLIVSLVVAAIVGLGGIVGWLVRRVGAVELDAARRYVGREDYVQQVVLMASKIDSMSESISVTRETMGRLEERLLAKE